MCRHHVILFQHKMNSIHFLLIFTLFIPAFSQEDQNPVAEVTPPPTPSPSPTPPPLPNYYDYILNVTFELDETKLSNYIVNLIYSSQPSAITPENILKLYGIDAITLDKTRATLASLNVSNSKLLSIEGVEILMNELELSFSSVYTRVFQNRLQLQGVPLKDFLEALGIDVNALSQGISFGTPDPFVEFKKGDFSEESLQNALTAAGKTESELFEACRDEFVEKAVTLPKETVVTSLRKNGVDQRKALQLWNALGLTSNQVHGVPVFHALINEITQKLNSSSIVGILIGPNSFIINSKAYELWKNDAIANIFAQSYSKKTQIQLRQPVDANLGDGIVGYNFRDFNVSSEKVSYASTASTGSVLDDCSVVVPQGDALVAEHAFEVTNRVALIEVQLNSTITDLPLGSPLICQDVVYGLLRNAKDNVVEFDSFYVEAAHGKSDRFGAWHFLSVLLVFYVLIF